MDLLRHYATTPPHPYMPLPNGMTTALNLPDPGPRASHTWRSLTNGQRVQLRDLYSPPVTAVPVTGDVQLVAV